VPPVRKPLRSLDTRVFTFWSNSDMLVGRPRHTRVAWCFGRRPGAVQRPRCWVTTSEHFLRFGSCTFFFLAASKLGPVQSGTVGVSGEGRENGKNKVAGMAEPMDVVALAERVKALAVTREDGLKTWIAVAGPPGGGKTTLCAKLAEVSDTRQSVQVPTRSALIGVV